MVKKYDIILTCNYSPWSKYKGGGQKSTHMIATSLKKLGFSVAVVYSKGLLENITVPNEVKYDVHWAFFFGFKPNMSAPFRFLNPWSFKKVLSQISSKQTVIHSNGEEGSFFDKVPHKTWLHSNRFPDFPKHILNFDLKSPKTPLSLFLRDPKYFHVQNCIQKSNALTVTSTHNQNRVLELFGRKGSIVPNGIDSLFLEKTWAPASTNGFFYYGRMVKAKGVDTLLQAYSALPKEIKDKHQLTLVGEGKESNELKAMAKSLNIDSNCKFLDWADSNQIIDYLTQSALAILPSREESFGNTMLESLATGIPLISTLAGSIPEVVGPHGTLIPIDSPETLCTTILDNLNIQKTTPLEQIDTLVSEQQNYIRKRFSWESTSLQFLSLYGINQ